MEGAGASASRRRGVCVETLLRLVWARGGLSDPHLMAGGEAPRTGPPGGETVSLLHVVSQLLPFPHFAASTLGQLGSHAHVHAHACTHP